MQITVFFFKYESFHCNSIILFSQIARNYCGNFHGQCHRLVKLDDANSVNFIDTLNHRGRRHCLDACLLFNTFADRTDFHINLLDILVERSHIPSWPHQLESFHWLAFEQMDHQHQVCTLKIGGKTFNQYTTPKYRSIFHEISKLRLRNLTIFATLFIKAFTHILWSNWQIPFAC